MTPQEEQKPVRTLLNDLYSDLRAMIFKMCKGSNLFEDLFQETCLDSMQYFKDEKFTESRFKVMFYRVAQFKWFYGDHKGGRDSCNFHFKFRLLQNISVTDEVVLRNIAQGENEEIILKDLIEVSTLTQLEKVLLNKYLEVSCKVSQMSRDLDVSVNALNARLEVIKDKLKNAGDIYFN